MWGLALGITLLGGCAGCSPEETKFVCEEGVDCPVEPCTNVPRIVRTQFEPKEGRVPFDVTFNVVAEDADTIVCSETLTYHFDFDGDGNEDATSKKGRYVNRYTKAGKYDVKIWVTDSANSLSKPVNKFVVAEDNKGPVVLSLLADPSSSVAGSFVTMLAWQAYDPDGGTLAAIKVDFGDGSPLLLLSGDQATAYHMFTKAGQFVITVTAVDADGAEFSRSTEVVVVISSRPSSLVQTIGSSQAIALDDNEGQYWSDANGPFLYGYVADGAVALKTVKYPLSAFAASNLPQGEAELIGWADPGHALDERWDDVVRYRNLVVVSGSQGMQLFNVRAEPASRTCTAEDYAESKARFLAGDYRVSQHCYPGTPTQPAVICAPGGGYTSGMTIRGLQLLRLEDGSGAWAVGNVPTGGSSNGGLQLLRLDTLLTDDYYVDPSRCPGGWQHLALNGSEFTGNNNVIGSNTHGMVIDREHAYVGMSQGGLYVLPVGDYARNRAIDLNPTFRLNDLPQYFGMQTVGYGVAIAKARPVSETMYDFPDIGLRQQMYGSIGNGNCDERKVVLSASNAATEAVIHIAGPMILPGNRVAIEKDGSTDDNGGAGYLVTRNEAANGNFVIGYAAEPTSLTAGAAVYPIPVSFGVLPAYPGRNPVVFSSSQAGSLAMNGVCRNFVNAYAPIVEPVGVQYQSAPLGFVALDSIEDGILVFDQSDAAAPEILAFVSGRAPAEHMIAHGNYLYMSGGYLGKVDIMDVSDPDHMDLNFGSSVRAFRVGTHCYLTCSFTERDFSINRMEFVTTPTNADGVLLIPGGNVGMNALSVAGAIQAGNVNTSCPADAPSSSNACFTNVAGLQLRHEGTINDIQMVGNQYALVSQERGGVLVFDTSAIPYLGSVTFVAHVRTADNPLAMRVVTDAAGAPQSLWIADATSFYKVAFTNPAKPGTSIQVIRPGKSEFNCVEYTSGKIFVCFSEPDPANQGLTREMAWFANGDTIPTTTIRMGLSSTLEYCTPSPTVVSAGFLGLSTAWLAGRFMMFVETVGNGNVLRELKTDGNKNIIVSANAATGCHWNAGSIRGVRASYQERKGATSWKRLYTVFGGVIEALDIDGFEAELALGGFDTNIGPAPLGERDLSVAVGGTLVNVQRLVALGPYLFVAGEEKGAFILDASVAENMQIIGQTSISVARPIVASTLNAMAYTAGDPNDPATRYTYTVLISDNTLGGGIQLIEFPGLERP